MNQIINFNNMTVRMSGDKLKPMFCAKDVCQILGIKNCSDACSTLSVNQRVSVCATSNGGTQKTTFVTESGLYRLIFKSKKEQALNFQNFVCQDVLPCIRQHGCYPAPEPEPESVRKRLLPFDNNVKMITTECILHQTVINYIKKYCPALIYTCPLGELQDSPEKRKYAFYHGYISGMPDLIILNNIPNSYNGFALEFKSPRGNGVLSPDQKTILDRFEKNGFKTLVSNDYDKIITSLYDYHYKLEHVVMHQCTECKKVFKNENTYNTHMEKYHPNETPDLPDSYVFTFGKHKNSTWSHVVETHPSYIKWLKQQPLYTSLYNRLNRTPTKKIDYQNEYMFQD